MTKSRFFTSESVTEGHPDKVADAISDAVLDAVLTQDPNGKVACETLVTRDLVVLAGELNFANGPIDLEAVTRNTIAAAGYDRFESEELQVAFKGFDSKNAAFLNITQPQSSEITKAVDKTSKGKSAVLGAGDQGIMFGYAKQERDLRGRKINTQLLPLPIYLAHRLAEKLSKVRKQGDLDTIYPDAKTQVTVEYKDEVPIAITKLVISVHTKSGITKKDLTEELWQQVIRPVVDPTGLSITKKSCLINPSGSFLVGGPGADTGLTGRKIIVDTYGGYARHGGGAFSGKDPTKVDRSAAYISRYVAKNVVAAGLAQQCEIQLSYAIGKSDPLSVWVETKNTLKEGLSHSQLRDTIIDVFDFSPQAIIEHLGLRQPIYSKTTCYGHFGRSGFSWEKTDQTKALKAGVGLS